MEDEKVSVLIPTFNRNAYLHEALDSLQAQTYSHWEAIIVDNSSWGAAHAVVDCRRDPRLKYIRLSQNLGECRGRNIALAASTGSYVCYLDDDDLLPEDSLEIRTAFYREHPHSGMIYADLRRFEVVNAHRIFLADEAPLPYLRKSYYDPLLARLGYGQLETFGLLKAFNFVRGGSPLIRRTTLQDVGGFDENLVAYAPYELWLRIASRYTIRYLNAVVYYYRQHSESTRAATSPDMAARCAEVICHRYGIQPSLEFAYLTTYMYGPRLP